MYKILENVKKELELAANIQFFPITKPLITVEDVLGIIQRHIDMQPTVRVVNCEKIKKCCDEINDIVKPLGYISHRTVQELLCEIINEVKNE